MKIFIRLTVLLFILEMQVVPAQDKVWTLEDCIDYGIENNIGLKRQMLQTESAEANLLKAKLDILPSLNLGSDARIGFGRSIDPVTNMITFKQNLSNSFSLSSTIQIFNGFATLNNISANKFMVKAGLENDKVIRNTLIINIMSSYYQVLYAKGLEEAAKIQLDLSERQLFRIRKTVDTGREALSRLYEMESRASEDRLSYTIARNSSSEALTNLKQLLQIEPGVVFDVMMPEMENNLIIDSSLDTDSVYAIASQTLPRLKAINYELMAARRQVAAIQGRIAPRLSVGGALFTGYYRVISEGVPDQASYSKQLKDNNSQALFMSLNIPIFNNYSTGREIRLAKNRRDDTELRLELEKNALYTEIENVCLNFNRGRDEYSAALANLEFNRKSFDAVEKKFEAGIVDVTDYSAAKTTLFRAGTETLRTRLQLHILDLTIRFYSTGDYETIIKNQH